MSCRFRGGRSLPGTDETVLLASEQLRGGFPIDWMSGKNEDQNLFVGIEEIVRWATELLNQLQRRVPGTTNTTGNRGIMPTMNRRVGGGLAAMTGRLTADRAAVGDVVVADLLRVYVKTLIESAPAAVIRVSAKTAKKGSIATMTVAPAGAVAHAVR